MKKTLVREDRTWFYSPKNGENGHVILMGMGVPKMIVAVLKMSDKEFEFQNQSVQMQQAIVDDTRGYFSPPFTPVFIRLAQWKLDNKEYLDGLNDFKNSVDGGEGRRDAALLALRITLWFAQSFVTGVMLMNQSIAVEIAGNAKMFTEQAGSSNKQEIGVSQTNAAGEISVKTLGAKNDKGKKITATYEREYTSDKGVTWVPMQANNKANDIAKGLDKNLIYVFRKRYTTAKGGTTPWTMSQPISPK